MEMLALGQPNFPEKAFRYKLAGEGVGSEGSFSWVDGLQGDQVSFFLIDQCLVKIHTKFFPREKSCREIWATYFCNFQNNV
jgi:hypothetical protein